MTRKIAGALMIVAVASPVRSAAGQTATFRSGLEVVRVDALVTENGRIVRGLTARDFEVRDNGLLQQIDFTSFEDMRLNVTLALDTSESVSGERLTRLRDASRRLLDALRPGDRAALLTFSHVVALRHELTGDVERVRSALDTIEAGGDTALVDAAHAAASLAEPEGSSRNLVIVFSDGHDTASWLSADRVLDSARRTDATIYGVTVRSHPRPAFLRDLCALTGGSTIAVDSTKDLSATFEKVLNEFRQRYVIGYSPRGVARDGYHRLEVRVKGRRATVTARPGYFAGP